MYRAVSTCIIIVLLAFGFRLWRVGRRPFGLPPGPPTIPLLGNIHLMPARDLHLQFQKWAQEYGPVYSLILGTKTMIVLSSPEAVRDLLDKRSAIYSDRQDHYLGGTILSQGNRMLMMRYGSTWRMIRRMYHSHLSAQKSASYVPYQDLENKQMLFEMLTQPDRFLDSVRRYSMSSMSNIVYGLRIVRLDDPRVKDLFHVLDTVTELVQSASAALLEAFPILRLLPDALSSTQKLAREQNKFEMNFFMSLWRNVKEAIKSETAKPCFCVDMAKEQEKEDLSDDLAAYGASTLLEAGADTTASTICAFIQAMVLFPDVQAKAQQVMDQVVDSERLPEMDDYSRLPYIRNCIKETTRWMPVAVMGFPHAVMEDDEYMGYHIPKGAGVFQNVYTIHMDPKQNPEPRRFEPDRYQDDDQGLAEFATNRDPSKRGTHVFGSGRRICQGMHVAEWTLFLAISRMIWAFDIRPAKDSSGTDILPDPDKYTQGFICMPEPFQAIITPRSPERAALIRKIWDDAQKELDPDSKQWK